MRFTRMDQFEDPLGGIPLVTLQRFTRINHEPSLNLANIILDLDNFFLIRNIKWSVCKLPLKFRLFLISSNPYF
jgi:hypothetical protein